MSGTIAILAATIFLASVIVWSQRRNSMQVAPREEAVTMKVQIICGDCAGLDRVPRRTFLTRKGECEQCGGHSFVLASSLARVASASAQKRMIPRMKIAV